MKCNERCKTNNCPLSIGMSAATLGKKLADNPFCDDCPHEKIKWTQGWNLGIIRQKVQNGDMSDSEAFDETFRIMGD